MENLPWKADSQNNVGLSGRCNQELYKQSGFHVEIGTVRRELKLCKIRLSSHFMVQSSLLSLNTLQTVTT